MKQVFSSPDLAIIESAKLMQSLEVDVYVKKVRYGKGKSEFQLIPLDQVSFPESENYIFKSEMPLNYLFSSIKNCELVRERFIRQSKLPLEIKKTTANKFHLN